MDDGRTQQLGARDVELLREQLLGGEHAGKGLIDRTRDKVISLAHDPGPSYQTGSIIACGPQGLHETNEADVESVTDLALGLVEWLHKGIGSSHPRAKRMLIAWLAKHRVSDVDYLVGKAGKLDQVRHEAKALFKPHLTSPLALARLLELESYLRAWLGESCDHDFTEMDSDTKDYRTFVCSKPRCGARYMTNRGRVEWLAV